MTGIITFFQEYSPCFLRNAAAPPVPYKPFSKIVLHLTHKKSKFLRTNLNRHDGMNSPKAEGLPHILIGEEICGQIRAIHTLPFEWNSDMCGNGELGTFDAGDERALQIAICKDRSFDYKYFRKVISAAADVCADMCERFRLSPGDIVSHAEAHCRWKANESINPDYWIERFGYSMDDFRRWVRLRIESDEELPIEKKNVPRPQKPIYVTAKDFCDDIYIDKKKEYTVLGRAIKYCPKGYRVYDKASGTPVYSRKYEPGVKVKIINPIIYGTPRSFVPEHDIYEIESVAGKRAVICYGNKTVAAVSTDFLEIL